MVHQTKEDDLAAIEKGLQGYPDGASARQVLRGLTRPTAVRQPLTGSSRSLCRRPASVHCRRHERSAFHPLEVPQLIDECFGQILAAAAAINDPFEQACFVMVQLPYLQPFDDVNKRVSRLAADIPLIRSNLSPLSFTDVPRDTCTEAVLGVYETKKVDLLKDVFIRAYERSAARYAAVRQSLGEPDPFRLRHRARLRDFVGMIVRQGMNRKQADAQMGGWSKEKIAG